jgi:quercetin dioxygenase-like cupin family protein
MEVVRLEEAKPYQAPRHSDMRGLRLQGYEASGGESFWVGLSYFLPGGGAEMDATPVEKVYVVVDGEVTVTTEEATATLGPLDSCRLAPNEARAISNRTNRPATMLVVMPYPPEGPGDPQGLAGSGETQGAPAAPRGRP